MHIFGDINGNSLFDSRNKYTIYFRKINVKENENRFSKAKCMFCPINHKSLSDFFSKLTTSMC